MPSAASANILRSGQQQQQQQIHRRYKQTKHIEQKRENNKIAFIIMLAVCMPHFYVLLHEKL